MGLKTRLLASGKTEDNEFNISLLGFKMAVNEGLTVFNLVDGVVDEFHDESGTDEGEGSNDNYVAASDYYINSTTPDGLSAAGCTAGFSTTAITEPQTSTTGTNPSYGSGTFGSYTVPACKTSINLYAFGAGAGSWNPNGGAGGFSKGVAAVTAGQSLRVAVGEGGFAAPLANSSPTSGQSFQTRSMGGGGRSISEDAYGVGVGGGLSGVFAGPVPASLSPQYASVNGTAPQAYVVAGGGGSSGYAGRGGGAGGLTGYAHAGESGFLAQTSYAQVTPAERSAGGGDQEQGGQNNGAGQSGGLYYGGNCDINSHSSTGGGSGFYGGGGAGQHPQSGHAGAGGGGSSYYGHPQVTSGLTYSAYINGPAPGAGNDMNTGAINAPTTGPQILALEGVPVCAPVYPGISEGSNPNKTPGNDGYVLITTAPVSSSATSTTIVSNAFAASSVPTLSRIVVFEENVDTPTLNTDIIASISRDGGSNFTTATLTDSGYVTGSSGQRILTGQASISGQPSGQSMRWKLALANNQVKIHGVSLQWS